MLLLRQRLVGKSLFFDVPQICREFFWGTFSVMKDKAVSVGEKIRNVSLLCTAVKHRLTLLQEDGVHTAIHALYTYMDRASRNRTSLQ